MPSAVMRAYARHEIIKGPRLPLSTYMPDRRLVVTPARPKDLADARAKVRKTLQLYLFIGLVLFFGTGLTVAIATVPWMDVGSHGFDKWDALLGLAIAGIKASLVAAVFMHLNHERALIYGIIVFGMMNAGGFFIGTLWHFSGLTSDTYFYRPSEHPTGLPSPAPNQAGW